MKIRLVAQVIMNITTDSELVNPESVQEVAEAIATMSEVVAQDRFGGATSNVLLTVTKSKGRHQ